MGPAQVARSSPICSRSYGFPRKKRTPHWRCAHRRAADERRLLSRRWVPSQGSTRKSFSHTHTYTGKVRHIEQDVEPDWVDWASVARGQKIWREHLGPGFLALSLGLLQGFSIARFAVVLDFNGYAQSAETAWDRYRATGFAIVDWMSSDLQDPNSAGRKAIYNIRAMHSFARRRATEANLFDYETEGVALSQYDMGEVQLAFSTIAFSIIEREMGHGPFARQELEDVTHAWRLVGYHLGVLDEFNVCNSLEESQQIFRDWMHWTPLRMATCRDATYRLQETAIDGFGKYTGSGREMWIGLLHYSTKARGFEVDYLKSTPIPGLNSYFEDFLLGLSNKTVMRVGRNELNRMKTQYETNSPAQLKRKMFVMTIVGRFNDAVVWPSLGFYARIPTRLLSALKAVVVLAVLKRIVDFARRKRLVSMQHV